MKKHVLRLLAVAWVGWGMSAMAQSSFGSGRCRKCGGAILSADEFCTQCGAAITTVQTYGSYRSQSSFEDVYFSVGLVEPSWALSIPVPEQGHPSRLAGFAFGYLNGFDRLCGLSIGVVNLAGNHGGNGLQLGLVNHGSAAQGGIHLGVWNVMGDEFSGVQIGVFNVAQRLYGVQIGVLNFNREGPIGFLPCINVGW